MSETYFLQPSTKKQLLSAMGKLTENSAILAGGTDLLIDMREKHREPDLILSLCKMKELGCISQEGTCLRIGSMVTHDQAANDPEIRKYFPALSMACSQVGSKQIRNKGTIGGNLMNASPAADMLPVMYLFHAVLEILSPDGSIRLIPVEELLKGPGRTVLQTGELLQAVRLPEAEGRKSCFVKLGARKEVTIAEISLAFSWEERDGVLCSTEGILGAVDTKPVILTETADFLDGRRASDIQGQAEALAESLAGRIRRIRENRTRPPRLRITEGERLYKERAVKGVVYDALELIRKTAGGQ